MDAADEQKTLKTIEKFSKTLPKFSDGRIDYSKSKIAPVITVFVKHKDRILLLKRSDKVRTHQKKWHTVAGYLDEVKPVRKKVLEELKEEVGVRENFVSSLHIGKSYKFTDNANKTWVVHAALAELKRKPKIKLDWEHTEFRWVREEEITKFDRVPHIEKSLKMIIQASHQK